MFYMIYTLTLGKIASRKERRGYERLIMLEIGAANAGRQLLPSDSIISVSSNIDKTRRFIFETAKVSGNITSANLR